MTCLWGTVVCFRFPDVTTLTFIDTRIYRTEFMAARIFRKEQGLQMLIFNIFLECRKRYRDLKGY